jgi:hypothetical protein
VATFFKLSYPGLIRVIGTGLELTPTSLPWPCVSPVASLRSRRPLTSCPGVLNKTSFSSETMLDVICPWQTLRALPIICLWGGKDRYQNPSYLLKGRHLGRLWPYSPIIRKAWKVFLGTMMSLILHLRDEEKKVL